MNHVSSITVRGPISRYVGQNLFPNLFIGSIRLFVVGSDLSAGTSHQRFDPWNLSAQQGTVSDFHASWHNLACSKGCGCIRTHHPQIYTCTLVVPPTPPPQPSAHLALDHSIQAAPRVTKVHFLRPETLTGNAMPSNVLRVQK